MIAAALKDNAKMRLVHFAAGRDRLENKGITALAEVFAAMQSLEVIEVPQNGIKKDGMVALLGALKASAASLREVHVHDNWIKAEAADLLVDFVCKARALERLNVSDSDMGTKNVFLVVKALHAAPARQTLTDFRCNYNESTSAKANEQLLRLLLSDFERLTYVEFKGNTLRKSAKKELDLLFEAANKKLVLFEEEEDEEEEEEEEEDEDEEDIDEQDILQRLEKLKL